MAGKILSDELDGGGGTMSAINITPLVDIMLCLLIIFMVAAPMMVPENWSKEVTLPSARGELITEEEFLYTVVSIDARGQVFLGTLPLSPDPAKMADELARNAKLGTDGRAFIQGDAAVPYERVLDVLVALKQAGVSDVGLVTDPKATPKVVRSAP